MFNIEDKSRPRESDLFDSELASAIYQDAFSKNPDYKEKSEQVRHLIEIALREIAMLETVAEPRIALEALTPEIAKNISAIWVVSASGNYEKPKGKDSWRDIPWADWSDRNRILYGVRLAKKISEVLDPEFTSSVPERAVRDFKEAKQRIARYGPTIIYNATDEMNVIASNALRGPKSIVPLEKSLIMGQGILNTADQMRSFHLPETLHKPGGEIGIVAHSPHFVRILRMLNKYKPLPPDMKIRAFPLKMPHGSEKEYSLLEVRGLLANVYAVNPPRATRETHPHIIHGIERVSG